jgi:hypothetical protein
VIQSWRLLENGEPLKEMWGTVTLFENCSRSQQSQDQKFENISKRGPSFFIARQNLGLGTSWANPDEFL